MLLTIYAPEVESRLEREAARRGLSPGEYARHLLELHLPRPSEVPTSVEAASLETAHLRADFGAQSFPTGNDFGQWEQTFEAWLNSHERRDPLPEDAFERASFYGEKA